MSLTIDNTTHWKSSDIERLVRAAMRKADADPAETRTVTVRYQQVLLRKGGTKTKRRRTTMRKPRGAFFYKQITTRNKVGALEIFLPKKGPKDQHPNAMVTLAISASIADAGIAPDATVLAVSVSYFLANALAFKFAHETRHLYDDTKGDLTANRNVLFSQSESIEQPSWGKVEQFFITKYADPKLDATYLARVKKKKTTIKLQETLIAKAEKELKAAQKRLRGAKFKKKTAEKSLKDMAARRS